MTYSQKRNDGIQCHLMASPGTPRRRRLTPNQRAVLKFVIANPDATLDEIGRACNLTPSHPAGGAHAVLHSENVQQRMLKLMDSRPRLQDEALMIKLEEGLDSTKTDHVVSQRTGEVHTFKQEDMPTRKQYLDLAVRLKGALKNQTEVSGPNGGPIPLTPAPIVALASMTKEQLIDVVRGTK